MDTFCKIPSAPLCERAHKLHAHICMYLYCEGKTSQLCIPVMHFYLNPHSFPQAQSSTGVSSKGSRPPRRPNSVAGTPHMRRSRSVIHPRDLVSLEEDLAKQTRKLQRLKSQGTPADTLQREKETLKRLQDDLARGMMHRSFRQQKGGVSRWFMPRSHEAGDTPAGGSMGHRISQAVKKQLFNQQGLFSFRVRIDDYIKF